MLNESLRQVNEQFAAMLYQGALLSKVAFAVLCFISLYLFVFSLRNRLKRRWESTYFVFLCLSVLVWALCSLGMVFAVSQEMAVMLHSARNVGVIFIPALLYLHTHHQVSYKERYRFSSVMLFVVPGILLLIVLQSLLFPNTISFLWHDDIKWLFLIFYLYALVVLIRSYLLCFNVFYQMPRRMRRSTRYMLFGISAVVVLLFMNLFWNNLLATLVPQSAAVDILLPLAAPLAFCVLLFPLYQAMHLMPASDVIVTSREFVVGGLATTILVLNRKKRILDWNRKLWNDAFPLPEPLYKEPFDIYRKRMLQQPDCRVSPHSEDVVTTRKGADEMHFLMTTRDIGNRKKRFGFIVEISEVTPIYAIVRYFEEIAYFDQLTGVYNRNAYLSLVEKILKDENMPLLILVGDVNRLKHINDTYGHLLGDNLLVTVADIIKKSAPEGAFISRVGGDEFVLLIPNGSVYMAEVFFQKADILRAQREHEIFGRPSISWGYSLMISAKQSYNEVFSEADTMMYGFKKLQYSFRSSGLLPRQEEIKSLKQPKQWVKMEMGMEGKAEWKAEKEAADAYQEKDAYQEGTAYQERAAYRERDAYPQTVSYQGDEDRYQSMKRRGQEPYKEEIYQEQRSQADNVHHDWRVNLRQEPNMYQEQQGIYPEADMYVEADTYLEADLYTKEDTHPGEDAYQKADAYWQEDPYQESADKKWWE